MKLNISLDKELEGYTNIEPRANLDSVAQPNECTEILALDLMNFIPSDLVYSTLQHYTSKLRHKGRIIIGGTDLILLAKDIVTQRLNIVEANRILHGHSGEVKKNGQISLCDLSDIMEALGLVIKRKKIENLNFIIEGERP